MSKRHIVGYHMSRLNYAITIFFNVGGIKLASEHTCLTWLSAIFFISSLRFLEVGRSYQNRTNEPVHEISNNVVIVISKASDQPMHRRSLIRAFASRLSIL